MSDSQRERWTAAATDYVLERGLIGLSLRPLAAELGTSDRMLLYHFGSKDELVAAVLEESNTRSTARVDAMPASAGLRAAVLDLWAVMSSPPVDRCSRLYVEAAALRLFGQEPYATVVRDTNAVWMAAVERHLVRSGATRAAARRAAIVVDAAFMGFLLDLPLEDGDSRARDRAVRDLADALSGGRSGR